MPNTGAESRPLCSHDMQEYRISVLCTLDHSTLDKCWATMIKTKLKEAILP